MATPHHDHDSGEGLLSVEEAREKVLSQIEPLQPLELPLTDAYGCVLAQDVVAERDLPEFASSAMDGYAVRSSEVRDATQASPVELRVVGRALMNSGRRLQAPELALLATAGISHPLVRPRARVVVLSTGDELIPPFQTPEFGQVRDSNAYSLFGAIREAGAAPILAGIVKDDVDSLKDVVLSHLGQADVLVSSGGVSVGERDVVKAAFLRRGEFDFFRVAMQPGMPQGFGHIEGKPYFGLPGNPVSVFVSFEVFIRPALLKMAGRRDLFRPEVTARLDAEVEGPRGKT